MNNMGYTKTVKNSSPDNYYAKTEQTIIMTGTSNLYK